MKKCKKCKKVIDDYKYAVLSDNILTPDAVLCLSCVQELNTQLFVNKQLGTNDFVPELSKRLLKIMSDIHEIGDNYCNSEGHSKTLDIMDDIRELVESETPLKVVSRLDM